jgi:hypothetical protein
VNCYFSLVQNNVVDVKKGQGVFFLRSVEGRRILGRLKNSHASNLEFDCHGVKEFPRLSDAEFTYNNSSALEGSTRGIR